VCSISRDEYRTRLVVAYDAAEREQADEGTREFRHRFASGLVDATGGAV